MTGWVPEEEKRTTKREKRAQHNKAKNKQTTKQNLDIHSSTCTRTTSAGLEGPSVEGEGCFLLLVSDIFTIQLVSLLSFTPP